MQRLGKELWKVRGAPESHPDYRHLGNARLISYWPIRGGASVARWNDYFFGAGIWPSMGVFIKAVDAETGNVKWSNGEINYIEKVRIDHNQLHEAGLSPQGYFVFADGKLHVPNGRSMPAGFDYKNRQNSFQYVQGYRNGDSRVTSSGKLLFVGDNGVVNTTDGREVGDRWKSAGKDAPKGWSTPKRDLFEGPFWGAKGFQPAFLRNVRGRRTATLRPGIPITILATLPRVPRGVGLSVLLRRRGADRSRRVRDSLRHPVRASAGAKPLSDLMGERVVTLRRRGKQWRTTLMEQGTFDVILALRVRGKKRAPLAGYTPRQINVFAGSTNNTFSIALSKVQIETALRSLGLKPVPEKPQKKPPAKQR